MGNTSSSLHRYVTLGMCLRPRTLPGEQAQVDWAHFGKLTVGHAVRRMDPPDRGAAICRITLTALG